ncbi:NUDIX hydrolase [Thaumasiovibrio subtropicus]|uniref:NUDIX hydrolase n=1 Tax=Thaumasiovibrio subtropicus TaxID=1891207 RepID=UPI000B34F4D5|nr:NUDIX domain-containing protein [Thaumasiovibrio subtropicus]
MTRSKLKSVAWVLRRDGKVLCVKSKNKDKFFVPGGKFELGESAKQALCREIAEELSVTLKEETMRHVTTIHDIAYGLPNTDVEMACYSADYVGEIVPNAEIETVAWVDLETLHCCAPAAQQLVTFILSR